MIRIGRVALRLQQYETDTVPRQSRTADQDSPAP
ncbi:hypothetical protein P3T29_003819 [Kitasatospora sp. MAP5-34]|nr:hypothetical protein [Kitasatospora sp. MAP5-34]